MRIFLLTIGLVGCASSRKRSHDATNVDGLLNDDPVLVLQALSNEVVANIRAYGLQVSVPERNPFVDDESLSQVYTEWYRTGYAFAFVTGVPRMRDQVSREARPGLDRAKFSGWFDGNDAGRLVRWRTDIESALERLRSVHAK